MKQKCCTPFFKNYFLQKEMKFDTVMIDYEKYIKLSKLKGFLSRNAILAAGTL